MDWGLLLGWLIKWAVEWLIRIILGFILGFFIARVIYKKKRIDYQIINVKGNVYGDIKSYNLFIPQGEKTEQVGEGIKRGAIEGLSEVKDESKFEE